jgi:hypothetical protein
MLPPSVIPVKTGIQNSWIPVSAGMTDKEAPRRYDGDIFMFRYDRELLVVGNKRRPMSPAR